MALISGSLFSHIGLALASWAKQRKTLYLAAEPLADALVWAKGNNYTFRLRPSTYMQAAMLAAEAAKRKEAKRWATIAPNYAYGKDAVAAFQKVLKKLRPDVTFVRSQWPGLFKIDAGAEVQALAAAKPDAIYNVTFGGDLAKFVREGRTRGLFKGKLIVGLLTGEPEYIDPLKDEAPVGWLVTGYPWQDIDTAAHKKFLAAYQARWNDYPRIGSIVGYNTMLAIQAMLKKAGSTDTDKMVAAMKGLSFDAPTGPITFPRRGSPVDHGRLCRLDGAQGRQGHDGALAISRRRELPAVGRGNEEAAQAVNGTAAKPATPGEGPPVSGFRPPVSNCGYEWRSHPLSAERRAPRWVNSSSHC